MIIFYKPETLQIMGMSDGEASMQYPYIEIDEYYHATDNLYLEKNEAGEIELKFKKVTLD